VPFPGLRRNPRRAQDLTRIIPGDWETPILAQLDTGAAWSVLDTEIAEELGLFDELGEDTKLSTRAGTMEGVLVHTPVTLVADEGRSLAHWSHRLHIARLAAGDVLGLWGAAGAYPFRNRPRRERFLLRYQRGLALFMPTNPIPCLLASRISNTRGLALSIFCPPLAASAPRRSNECFTRQ
jgi:hypothetical protein